MSTFFHVFGWNIICSVCIVPHPPPPTPLGFPVHCSFKWMLFAVSASALEAVKGNGRHFETMKELLNNYRTVFSSAWNRKATTVVGFLTDSVEGPRGVFTQLCKRKTTTSRLFNKENTMILYSCILCSEQIHCVA